MMRQSISGGFAVALLASIAMPAHATYYAGTQSTGTMTADIMIRTDGAVGVLHRANILDWLITLSDGTTSVTLKGARPGRNSALDLAGDALTATPDAISFDFGAASGHALFQYAFAGSSQAFFCVQINGCFDFAGPGLGISPYTVNNAAFTRIAQSGSVVLASVVPEPAGWTLMTGGVLAIGTMLRRRRSAYGPAYRPAYRIAVRYG